MILIDRRKLEHRINKFEEMISGLQYLLYVIFLFGGQRRFIARFQNLRKTGSAPASLQSTSFASSPTSKKPSLDKNTVRYIIGQKLRFFHKSEI